MKNFFNHRPFVRIVLKTDEDGHTKYYVQKRFLFLFWTDYASFHDEEYAKSMAEALIHRKIRKKAKPKVIEEFYLDGE